MEVQRRAVLGATYSKEQGVWHLAGWYCAADKRVRYVLAGLGLLRDYLRRSNRLTPLGLAVRDHLKEQPNG